MAFCRIKRKNSWIRVDFLAEDLVSILLGAGLDGNAVGGLSASFYDQAS